MGESHPDARRTSWASVRVRTTAAATGVVALALVLGAVALTLLLRASLVDGLEQTAEQRADALGEQVEADGPPELLGGPPDEEDDDGPPDRRERLVDDDLEEEVLEQVAGEDGSVVVATTGLVGPLPTEDGDDVRLDGLGGSWVVATTDAETLDGAEYVVTVAVPAEPVADSTAALLPLLGIGLPVVLLVVGATTWVVVGRALAPVERIRTEVDAIGGDALDRRVPQPRARDEIGRLAATMNRMLDRLEASAERQRRFVSDASHELRSPIASLRQTAEVARSHPGALPDGELAETTWEESVRMQRLVDQLLTLTRADEAGAAPYADVDLDDLLLAEAARLRRDDGVEVDVSGVAPVRVRGDAGALAQVTRNLVDNAARHAHGVVRVGCAAGGAHGGRTAELWVADDGAGVPDAERERVFERFVRLDEARSRDAGGSGLGLAIVRGIARAHGGDAHVEPAPGGGARFVVRLPAGAPSGS